MVGHTWWPTSAQNGAC